LNSSLCPKSFYEYEIWEDIGKVMYIASAHTCALALNTTGRKCEST